MGSKSEEPQLIYPAPLEAGRDAPIEANNDAPVDFETPILIVGGGPVGMLQALILARLHGKPCMLIERESTTTHFPKMEYTNGRSMEIYRMMGLADDVRTMAAAEVPQHCTNNEIIVTSMSEGGKLLHVWEHDGPAEQRRKSKLINDGSQYLEPHMRCHQILIEKWLKERVDAEKLVQSFWGTAFAGLEEKGDHVISVIKASDGTTKRIKSQYVIGCDGGGSWVRKSVGLESKRKSLNMTVAFVHFRSAALRASIGFPQFWHGNVIAGGVLVSQNEDDLWTCHFMVPPDMDPTNMTPEEIISLALGGCKGQVSVAIDEIRCRGIWKTDIAIADAFRSANGRVFLAGDAAHQLSPLGGHGLNSGLGDAFDLAWKLSATLRGWAGDKLLASYDVERRQIAAENLGHVQHALETVVLPIFMSHLKYGADVLSGDGEEANTAREKVIEHCQRGSWLHDQNGNILGYSYKTSPVVVENQEVGERMKGTDQLYVPTTWPGSQAPHVWMKDGKSTLDRLSAEIFNLVDFSADGVLSANIIETAAKVGVPLQVLKWNGEENVRKVYERDLVLIRPDMHVAWRSVNGIAGPPGLEEAESILSTVSGRVQ